MKHVHTATCHHHKHTHHHHHGHKCNHDHGKAQAGKTKVSPGVVDMRNRDQYLPSADAASEVAAKTAEKAGEAGTFAVGGVLLGPDGDVIALSQNAVLQDGHVQDPTAHGERQLVDWYFDQVHKGADLPAPEDLTIVSSLDPCMMCSGSILESGMNVTILAPDELNGVDFRGDGEFSTLPKNLRPQAQERFSYLGVEGKREFQGSSEAMFADAQVSPELENRSLEAFLASLDPVKEQISNSGDVAVDQLKDVSQSEEMLSILREFDPKAGTVKVENPLHPGAELAPSLMDAAKEAKSRGANYDAASLIDPFGNVLLTMGGQEQISPIRTPLMEMTRTYTKVREKAGDAGKEYLPHLKHCKLVVLQGPGPEATSVMEMGAYGSSVEGALPEGSTRHWQYVLPSQTQQQLDGMIADLPPLYSEIIRPDIEQVTNQGLIDAFSAAARGNE